LQSSRRGALGVTHLDASTDSPDLETGEDTLLSIIGGTRTTMGNGMVLGLEADYTNTTSFGSDYLGSVRAVGGIQIFDGNGLLFATAGYANNSSFTGGLAIGPGAQPGPFLCVVRGYFLTARNAASDFPASASGNQRTIWGNTVWM
jgi:hypothetical protein